MPSSLCGLANPACLLMEDSSRGLSDPGWSRGTGLSGWEGSAALGPGLLCSPCCPVGRGGQRRETECQSLLATEPCQARHLLTTPLLGPALPGHLHVRPGCVSAGLGWVHSELLVPPRASPEAEVCCCGTDVVRGQEEHTYSGLSPNQTSGGEGACPGTNDRWVAAAPAFLPGADTSGLSQLPGVVGRRCGMACLPWESSLGGETGLSSEPGLGVLPGLQPQHLPPSHCGTLSQLLWAPQHLPLPSTFLTSQSLGLVFCGLVFWKRQACGLGLPPFPAVQRVQPVPPTRHLAP